MGTGVSYSISRARLEEQNDDCKRNERPKNERRHETIIAMLRRRHVVGNVGASTLLPVSKVPESSARGKQQCCGRITKFYFFIIALAVWLVYHLLLDEYAWVHRRCLKASIFKGTVAQVECVEATTHKLAALDLSLSDETILATNINFNKTSASQHVHYTITTPLFGSKLYLALCSMEAIGRLCNKGGVSNCIINVWIVDQARRQYENGTWFHDIHSTLGDYSYCLRLVGSSVDKDELIGTACMNPLSSCKANNNRLRDWLSTSLATNQLPAHVSDAWRLVALNEIGGLYLDADVLPISPNILHLPSPTVTSQQKVGAYRLNGGTLRMDAHVFCNGDDNISNEKKSDLKHTTTFLEALVSDHLEWAPRLAMLPQAQQTFGFLGPCALTRVYTDHRYSDDETVTVLPHQIAQPPRIDAMKICNNPDLLAIHFTGSHKKDTWTGIMHVKTRKSCLKDLVQSSCPRILDKLL